MSFTNCCNHRFIGDNHSPIQPDGYCLHCGFHPDIEKLKKENDLLESWVKHHQASAQNSINEKSELQKKLSEKDAEIEALIKKLENEDKVITAWKESYTARTDEVMHLRGTVFKLRKESQEMREALGKTRKELATALNFLQSMKWQYHDVEEPEFQCQYSLSETLFNLHKFNLSETPNSSKKEGA